MDCCEESICLKFKNVDTEQELDYFINLPCLCPHCKRNVDFQIVDAYTSVGKRNTGILLVNCPACRSLSTFYYTLYESSYTYNNFSAIPEYSMPFILESDIDIPVEIKEISPYFERLLNNALRAEDCGLNDLAYIGYRKALEFLVKDFCIYKRLAEEEIITNEPLERSIRRLEFISSNIGKIAEKIKNIGNDATHYKVIYCHDDFDIKNHIKILLYFIQGEILANQELKRI